VAGFSRGLFIQDGAEPDDPPPNAMGIYFLSLAGRAEEHLPPQLPRLRLVMEEPDVLFYKGDTQLLCRLEDGLVVLAPAWRGNILGP